MHCTLLPTKNVWNWEVYTYFACLVTRKLQSLFKFRLTITQCEDNQTYGFKLLNLSEEPLDCTISLDVCDERKNKAKNQMVLVLREENVKLENMTSYYQALPIKLNLNEKLDPKKKTIQAFNTDA